MNTPDTTFISFLIKKHMALLGTTAALSCARSIKNLAVADNGDVLRVENPATTYKTLEKIYISFAGEASRALSQSLHQRNADKETGW